MRRIVILMAAFLFVAGWCCAGYCQTDDGSVSSGDMSDSGRDAEMGTEIESEKAQSEGELNEADADMDSHSTSQTAVDNTMNSGDQE